ncbi:ribosomal-protein-alanine N-acetyltransferase [Terrihabitans soli]|uniref:Ribosomal-protein-alanine N-acetyltransferase n=1 Tax=Terrihabitans soli TaxID=708113 RepID=A0A6S6QX72_9HYPH|nr:GNAT family protein [Terrihabitans soli]BCJ91640.1 ribosomal-protein-alanine N-acetyltransferase [Terrihabitans soli]
MSFLRSFTDEDAAPLRGEGVWLRGPQPGDYEEWSELRFRSRDFLKPWEPTWPQDDLTRAAFRRRLRRYAEERRLDHAHSFFLFQNTTNRLLGGVTISNIRRSVAQTGTVGYWAGQPYAGKGFMTAGVRALVPHAFGALRLRRLEAACIPTNAASIRLLEKVGFEREGYAREYLCIDGIWQDHLLFALLRRDAR